MFDIIFGLFVFMCSKQKFHLQHKQRIIICKYDWTYNQCCVFASASATHNIVWEENATQFPFNIASSPAEVERYLFGNQVNIHMHVYIILYQTSYMVLHHLHPNSLATKLLRMSGFNLWRHSRTNISINTLNLCWSFEFENKSSNVHDDS